jgi:hypothetical protein
MSPIFPMARDKGANVLVRQLLCRLQLTLGQGPGNVPPFLLRQRQQDETVEAKAVPFFKESPLAGPFRAAPHSLMRSQRLEMNSGQKNAQRNSSPH